MHRREFLNASLIGGLSTLAISPSQLLAAAEDSALVKRITHVIPTKMYDGKRCWCHSRAGIIPGRGNDGQPRIVMTMNTLDVSGSDVFKAMYSLHSDDGGQTWTEPQEQSNLAMEMETIDGVERPVAVSDFWPTWHRQSGQLLGTGHTVVYTPDWKVRSPRPRHTSYSVYDAAKGEWRPWRKLKMPELDKFYNSGAGCTQRFDLDDGTILLPISFKPPGQNSRVTVARCTFDGETLAYVEHGSELHIDDDTRGLGEPSLTRFGDEFFLTIRNDRLGFVSRSRDGMNFEPIQPWRFDDGELLGSYNTQQHWATHSDGLFLVYTRKGADNDHVFRHRAPLFMAQVDPESLAVLRETERVVVPERGARLGNFGVTQLSPRQTLVTVAEWMQTWGPNHILPVDNKYGSDGSVWVARIEWTRDNGFFQV